MDYKKVETGCSDFRCSYKEVAVGWTFTQAPYKLSWQEARAINDSNRTIYGAKLFLAGLISSEVGAVLLGARVGSILGAGYGIAGFTTGPSFSFDGGDIITTTVEVRAASLMLNDDAVRITRTINVIRGKENFSFVNKNF
ncbi:hypothetical protein ACJJIC_16520 [Microbulbifer sp. ANSA002]|uniref:hypothetical protein n=1 Tax=unclassified Microbulbifer TaxID=2619833 RepID=UPI0040413844